ncbi:hypothetical protein CC86DRAFT_377814 [Ophiobolus disseminans]|uniref:Uncharacterized protein n=1 Tax=Ophiobolus disseminans TaxID=1469910 RepID=A0A6A7AHB4_9PLEO|nr:hypothetical protein CC86DRAFT_377814 [Ophiobolus disseminans]
MPGCFALLGAAGLRSLGVVCAFLPSASHPLTPALTCRFSAETYLQSFSHHQIIYSTLHFRLVTVFLHQMGRPQEHQLALSYTPTFPAYDQYIDGHLPSQPDEKAEVVHQARGVLPPEANQAPIRFTNPTPSLTHHGSFRAPKTGQNGRSRQEVNPGFWISSAHQPAQHSQLQRSSSSATDVDSNLVQQPMPVLLPVPTPGHPPHIHQQWLDSLYPLYSQAANCVNLSQSDRLEERNSVSQAQSIFAHAHLTRLRTQLTVEDIGKLEKRILVERTRLQVDEFLKDNPRELLAITTPASLARTPEAIAAGESLWHAKERWMVFAASLMPEGRTYMRQVVDNIARNRMRSDSGVDVTDLPNHAQSNVNGNVYDNDHNNVNGNGSINGNIDGNGYVNGNGNISSNANGNSNGSFSSNISNGYVNSNGNGYVIDNGFVNGNTNAFVNGVNGNGNAFVNGDATVNSNAFVNGVYGNGNVNNNVHNNANGNVNGNVHSDGWQADMQFEVPGLEFFDFLS